MISAANVNDAQLLAKTLDAIVVERPQPTPDAPQHLCLDKGYAYDEVREIVAEFGFTAHIPPKGKESQQVKRKARGRARRYVVERTHSWMNRFRGILIRWCKKPENYIAMLHFALALITYRAAGLSG